MPAPYDKTTHDGKTVDWLTKAALLEAEKRLGYPLTIVQGSYHKGVGASAGTHDGGGVVDLAPWDWARKVRVLRQVGFAIWHRPTLPGVWGEHIHGVLIGNAKLSPSAARQVTAYFNGRDGLAGNRVDPSWKPDPIPTFKWPGAIKVPEVSKEPSVGTARIDGVDLSHHNPVTKDGLAKAKAAGIKWVSHKATEGTTVKDDTYSQRRAWCKALGITFGPYHFARPSAGENGTSEARYFLAAATPQPGDLAPMLDLEDDGGMSHLALTTWVRQFVAECIKQTSQVPIVYTSYDLMDTFDAKLWVPRYNDAMKPPRVPAPWTDWDIWQFSQGINGKPNRVAGLPPVDLNTMRGNLADYTLGTMKEPDEMNAADWTRLEKMLDDKLNARLGDVVKVPASDADAYPDNPTITAANAQSRAIDLSRQTLDAVKAANPGN